MLVVVETYVSAPDHVGGTEPFISTPDFVGSIFPAVRTRDNARVVRPVGHLLVEVPPLVRAKRGLGQALERFIELRIRAPQRFDLGNGQHSSRKTVKWRTSMRRSRRCFIRQLDRCPSSW